MAKDAGTGSKEIEVEYKNGFTWRVLMASIYAAVVFIPANLFMMVLTNATIGGGYTTLLFFVAIAAIFGSPLTRQEAWTLQALSTSIMNPVALSLLQSAYSTRLCPEVWKFRTPDTNLPLPYVVPDWAAPRPDSPAFILRTFLHQDWMVPVALSASTFALAVLSDVALGFMTYQLYVVEEKLPFPMQQVDAEAVISLSERDPKRSTILYMSAFVGFIYSFLLYFVPVATGGTVLGPIPFADATRYFELWLRGSILGIATDISNFLLAFILPMKVIVNIFIGSIAIYVIGNAALVSMFPSAPAGLFGWVPGMPAQKIALWSNLYVWFGPIIGMSIVAALYPIFRHPRAASRAFTGLRTLSRVARGKGVVSLKWLIIAFLIGGVGYVALAAYLVPNAPIWIFIILSIVWPFLNALIQTRALGETTIAITVPYIREALYLTSYPGTDIWFAPVNPARGAGWAAYFKVCELTETKMITFVAAVCLAYLIGGIMSYVYVEMLWKVAPIPEGWPGSAMFWPLSATTSALWITRSFQFVHPEGILGGVAIGIILSLLGDFTPIPVSLISIVAGMNTWPHYAISYMIGALAYKILEYKAGKAWMQAHRVTIVAGFAIGSGISVTIASFWGLTSKAMFSIPF